MCAYAYGGDTWMDPGPKYMRKKLILCTIFISMNDVHCIQKTKKVEPNAYTFFIVSIWSFCCYCHCCCCCYQCWYFIFRFFFFHRILASIFFHFANKLKYIHKLIQIYVRDPTYMRVNTIFGIFCILFFFEREKMH